MTNRYALILLFGSSSLFFVLGLLPFLSDSLTDDQTPQPDNPTSVTDTAQPIIEPSLSAQDQIAASVATILGRPLFNAQRKPETDRQNPGDSTATDVNPEDAPLPRLAGIIYTGQIRRAIFQAGGDAKPLILSEGGIIDNYTIQQITIKSVIVAGPTGELVLQVKADPTANATAADQQPAPGFGPPGPGALVGNPAGPGYQPPGYNPPAPGQPPGPTPINGRQLSGGGEPFNVSPQPAPIAVNAGRPGGINPTIRLPPPVQAPAGTPGRAPRLGPSNGRQLPGAPR